MLEVQELTKKYGKNVAVDHVSFMVQDGQVGILLGPNGAGKTTLMNILYGLYQQRVLQDSFAMKAVLVLME